MKELKQKTKKIISLLEKKYPNPTTDLLHNSPFELLIATILSAQCTDKQVNAVTPSLFSKYPDAESLSQANLLEIETIIKSTGFYHNKAKFIIGCAKSISDRYYGVVPLTMEQLLTLSGVGRKTANCVLSIYSQPEGIVVDTHIIRLTRLLGLVSCLEASKIELELMKIVERND